MALRSVYSSGDEIPAEHKAFYREDGDSFVLDIEGIDHHPQVRGVITANKENIRKRDELKAKLTEAETRINARPQDSEPGGNALQALKDQHARAIEALKTQHLSELGERDSYIDGSLVNGSLKDALLEAGVNPDLLDGAQASLRGKVKVQRSDNGERKAIVETDLGEVGIADFVKDWAATRGKAYLNRPAGPAAQGSKSGGAGATTMSRADFDKLDPVAQQKAVIADKMTITD